MSSGSVQNIPIEFPNDLSSASELVNVGVIPSKPPRLRLPFLDGIRGLAALYVCLFHVREESLKHMSSTLAHITSPLHYGHEAVCVFIVLSGFCLMMPFVNRKSDETNPWPGIRQFVKRRAQRIFPAYYAALILSILLNLFSVQVFKAVGRGNFSGLDMGLLFPDLTIPNFAWHILLLHNLLRESSHFQNYPLWSIAMEWQIYFFFILLLLPLQRKIGISGTVLTALVISLIPHYFFPATYNLDWTYPWMLALFALGMAAAHITLTPIHQVKSAKSPRRWLATAMDLFALRTSPNLYWLTVGSINSLQRG